MSLTKPSIPPASPHRVGHYSGLHPEDQPYQSSMIAVQPPQVHEQQGRLLAQEPEHILLPEVDKTLNLNELTVPPIGTRRKTPRQLPQVARQLGW